VEERPACAVAEPRSCHGDGAVSNVMLCAGEARLVGWTQSGAWTARGGGIRAHELGAIRCDDAAIFEAAWGTAILCFARAHL